MKSNPVRIAVVGLRHGVEHLDHYRGRTDVEIVGLCDASADMRRQAGETYGVAPDALFADYQEMLRRAKPDAVFVMTPVPFHAPMTIQALEAGCHVLVAKSLCRTLEEGQAMLRARDRAGKKVEVGFQMHYAPVYRHVLEHLKDAAFGELRGAWIQFFSPSYFYAEGHWQNRRETMGGALLDCSIHSMDVLLYILGRPWKRVFASGRQFLSGPADRDTLDAATVLIDLEGGARLTLDFVDSHASSYVRTGIVGSRGKFEIEHWEPNGSGHVRFHSEARLKEPIGLWIPPAESSTGHIGIVEESLHFLDVCRGAVEPYSPLESALESLAAQQAILASLRAEAWVSRQEVFAGLDVAAPSSV